MTSSNRPPGPVPEARREPVLVREGGVPYRPGAAADPFVRWLALMEVVEALCPRWPRREPQSRYEDMRL